MLLAQWRFSRAPDIILEIQDSKAGNGGTQNGLPSMQTVAGKEFHTPLALSLLGLPGELLAESCYVGAGNSSSIWCRRWESNPHGFPHTSLSRARLPIPPLRLAKIIAVGVNISQITGNCASSRLHGCFPSCRYMKRIGWQCRERSFIFRSPLCWSVRS